MSRFKSKFLQKFVPLFILVIFMLFVGTLTTYASFNTYEVITGNDVPYSSVITTINLTGNQQFDYDLKTDLSRKYDTGSFGVPSKIKFPETKQHIGIVPANFSNSGWRASKGLAQNIITANSRQKIFGTAFIYMRYNTPTTRHLGSVLNDDVINIVTDSGWQFGYKVTQVVGDPIEIDNSINPGISKIIVVMKNDQDGVIKSFQASLVKVGERI